MRLLFVGDIVGRPGRRAVAAAVRAIRAEDDVSFVVGNCENAAGGKGVDPDAAEELRDTGIDVLTSGNHIWQHRTIVPYLQSGERLLRPLNFAAGVPGRGWTIQATIDGACKVAVVNLIGRAFMAPAECPFRAVNEVLDELRKATPIILVDMHGEATSEKVAMGWHLDGRVSAVVGSHTHVQTADARILPGGTAYITDAGMSGPMDSVLGMRTDQVLRRFLTQMPTRFEVATGEAVAHGVLIDVDQQTGKATAIRTIRRPLDS